MSRGNKSFSLLKRGGLKYLQSPMFEESGLVEHAFSTRTGGCSSGHLRSLNMAFHTGDNPDYVLENRRRFFKLFQADYRQIVSTIQVHGTNVTLFDKSQRGEGALPQSAKIRSDALVTTEPGLILSAYAADCQLLYFCALDRPLAAIAHAGKEGALGRIGSKLVDYLEEKYQVTPDRLLVALSPAVCRSCYQVSTGDADRFSEAGWCDNRYLEPAADERFKLDLGAINLSQLLTSGINNDNIAISGLCTSCNPDLFYSYRRDRGKTGRMIGFIALKNKIKG